MSYWFWHKEKDTETHGPVDDTTLKEMARSGKLQLRDRVWREGLNEWVIASSIPNLFAVPPPIVRDDASSYQSDGDTDFAQSPAFGSKRSARVRNEPPLLEPLDIEAPTTIPREEQSEQVRDTSPLQGVGGWLTFFCVVLTILGPLFGMAQMVSSYEEVKPAFDIFPTLRSAVWIENISIIALLIYGFITGMIVWRGNKNGKVLAERYLKIRLSVFVLVELLILGILSDLPEEVYDALMSEVFGVLIREAIFFGVWYAYFKKSERVAATYGS